MRALALAGLVGALGCSAVAERGSPSAAGEASSCVCGNLGCGAPNCELGPDGSRRGGWQVTENGDLCGMQLDCCVGRESIAQHCEALAERAERKASAPPVPPRPPTTSSVSESVGEDEDVVDWPPAEPNRVMTQCPSMGADTSVAGLVGKRFDNAFTGLPSTLRVAMSSSLDADQGLVVAHRDKKLVLIVTRAIAEGVISEVDSAFEIANPCPNLSVETGTCVVSGTHDRTVFALMDSLYTCGGHGESSPARAWRAEGGVAKPIDPREVTCGSISCEVDR